MRPGLTKKQEAAYKAVIAFDKKNNRAPTSRELAAILGHKYHSHIHRMLGLLVRKGYLKKEPRIHLGLYVPGP